MPYLGHAAATLSAECACTFAPFLEPVMLRVRAVEHTNGIQPRRACLQKHSAVLTRHVGFACIWTYRMWRADVASCDGLLHGLVYGGVGWLPTTLQRTVHSR